MSEETKPRALAGNVAEELRKALDSFVSQSGHGLRKDIRSDLAKHLTTLVCTFSRADREGMVLDLSELPEHVSLMIEGCGTLWWAELRVASEATEGEGATLAEAYNAALKAWKENRG